MNALLTKCTRIRTYIHKEKAYFSTVHGNSHSFTGDHSNYSFFYFARTETRMGYSRESSNGPRREFSHHFSQYIIQTPVWLRREVTELLLAVDQVQEPIPIFQRLAADDPNGRVIVPEMSANLHCQVHSCKSIKNKLKQRLSNILDEFFRSSFLKIE